MKQLHYKNSANACFLVHNVEITLHIGLANSWLKESDLKSSGLFEMYNVIGNILP